MPAAILTPMALWGNFEIKEDVTASVLKEKRIKDVVISSIAINGRETEKGNVTIRANFAKKVLQPLSGAIMLINGAKNEYNEKIVYDLAKLGYMVLSFNPTGNGFQSEGTEYPEDLNFAEYDNVKEDLYAVTRGVKNTCWYEWGVSVRYALKYLKSQSGVVKVGAIGINESATPLWHLIATSEEVECAVMVGNAGWGAYKNIKKWSGELDPQFSDDMLTVLAGIEPQAYAKSVKCPLLMLSPTNSGDYDVDRAFDTVERISDEFYRAVNYSVGYDKGIDYSSYSDIKEFFSKYLTVGAKKSGLPASPDIKAEIVDGKIEIEVTADKIKKEGEGLKEVSVFVGEGVVDAKLRSYKKLVCKKENGKFYFEYEPFHNSKLAVFFAQATYQTGYVVCSPVICKKFSQEQINKSNKSTVVYSSRTENAENVFIGIAPSPFDFENKGKLIVKNGPMDIAGVRAENGLITFKINAEKDKPKQDAILLFDVFMKDGGEFSAVLIADYFGERTEYKATVNVGGGKVWHNVMLELTRFKSEEGRVLKNYQTVNALKFNGENPYLINNVLWI